MAAEVRIIPNGLVTDPSRIAAGDGGLIVANNVLCRSQGLIEPRGGLRQFIDQDLYDEGYHDGRYVNEWDNAQHIACRESEEGGTLLRVIRRDDELLYTADDPTPEYLLRSEQFQARQMWNFSGSLRMLDSSSEGAVQPGVPGFGAFQRLPGAARPLAPLSISLSTSSPGALGVDETAAYRLAIVRYITDGLGARVPLIGAVSDRYVVRNTGIGTADVDFSVNVTGLLRAGDELQLYRTPTNGVAGADPGDELIYLATFPVASTMTLFYGDAQVTDFTDMAEPGEWSGPALYTNESQEGPSRANYRLRYANDIAHFQGKLFYAGGSAGWRQTVNVKKIGASPGDFSQSLFSPDVGVTSWTALSADVNVLSTSGIAIGQWFTRASADPRDTTPAEPYGYVTAVDPGGAMITLDRVQSTSGGVISCISYDWIGFATEGVSLYDTPKVFAPGPTTTGIDGFDTAVMTVDGPSLVSGAIERAFSCYATEDTGPEGVWKRMYSTTGVDPTTNVAVTIEYDASFGVVLSNEVEDEAQIRRTPRCVITSSKPYAFSERVYRTYAESTSRLANRDGNVATLWWSKQDQCEAVPLLNFTTIGDATEPIVRIFACTDRLMVLKSDGLWMVYGSGDLPDSMTVQLVDPSFKAIVSQTDAYGGFVGLPQWATKNRDTVYCWTRAGIMALGSGGVQRADSNIARQIRRYTPQLTFPFPVQPFASASVHQGLVVFGGNSSFIETLDGPENATSFAFVLVPDAGTWSTWSSPYLRWSTGPGESERGELMFASPDGCTDYWEIAAADTSENVSPTVFVPVCYDSITPVSFNPAVGTIDSVDAYDAVLSVPGVEGSMLVTGGYPAPGSVLAQVLDVNGTDVVLDVQLADPIAMDDCWLPVPCRITFSANQVPASEKHWLDTYVDYQLLRGGTEFSVFWRARGESDQTDACIIEYSPAVDGGHNATLSSDLERDQDISIPTEVSRTRGLETTILHNQASVYFALDALVLTHEQETNVVAPNNRRRR